MFNLGIPLLGIMLITIGLGAAEDVPFVFDEGAIGIASFTSAQLEQASSSSPDLAGVPPVSSQSDNEVLEFPIVGGGNAPVGKTDKKEEDLKKTVSSRVEPDQSTVHEVALLLVAKFPGDLTIDQICSIYSYMKNGEGSVKGWSYARDPRGSDFFMYANQSLKIGGKASCSGVGDCDDFAILMSALVESIGGTTRIIFAQNKTTGGHAYAEVYLGNLSDQNSQVDEIINWLKQKFNTDKIYTHIDTDTRGVWLNLDWGADEKGIAHPGGAFFQGDRHIVVYIRDDIPNTPLKLSATKEGAELSPAISLNITTDEIEGKSAEVWFNKGFALYSLGRYDEAINAYDEAISLDPKLATAWTNKGASLYKQGKYDEAIKAYDEAIKLAPNDTNLAVTWSNKGRALLDEGKYDEALKACDEAISLDPKLATAWVIKGGALFYQGKYDEAIQSFDKTIELDTQAQNMPISTAITGLNNSPGSAKAYNDSDLAEAWLSKGAALYAQGKYNEVIEALDEVIRLPTDDANLATAWEFKGRSLKALERTTEADAAFTKAKELGYAG